MSSKLFDWSHMSGKIFSSGWRDGSSVVDVIEPATGKVLQKAALGNAALVAEAAKKAKLAQAAWVQVPPEEKRKMFIKAEAVLREHAEEIEEWIMREAGATRGKAKFEINFASDEILEASSYPTQSGGMVMADRWHRQSYAVRVPYGVTAGITPFNVPLTLGSRYIAPALASGNAVLLKPHRSTIVCSGLVFARVFEEAGFPDGLLHVIPAEGKDAEAFETDPNISMVHFTGSTTTGRKIAEVASRTLKHVSISASGKNPFIVLDDAENMDAIAAGAIFATFFFSGQVCMAAGRHLIHESRLTAYLSKFKSAAENLVVADPSVNEKAYYGPMTTPGAAERIDAIIKDAVAKGAKIESGGKVQPPFVYPTILSGIKPGMRAWDEEVFGPVAAITTFKTDDEAVALANDTPYGLSAAVFGTTARATAVARRIESGMVHVNDLPVDDCAYVPFGGVKQSGTESSILPMPHRSRKHQSPPLRLSRRGSYPPFDLSFNLTEQRYENTP